MNKLTKIHISIFILKSVGLEAGILEEKIMVLFLFNVFFYNILKTRIHIKHRAKYNNSFHWTRVGHP